VKDLSTLLTFAVRHKKVFWFRKLEERKKLRATLNESSTTRDESEEKIGFFAPAQHSSPHLIT
jgi:hypothetical protein